MTASERDKELGTALLELDVPDHRPDFFAELRSELGEAEVMPRRRQVRWLAPAAAAAVLAGLAVAFALTRGPATASAALVRAAIEHALASDGSISGVFVNNETGSPNATGTRWRFVVSSSGAFRIEGLGTGSTLVYDPVRNVEAYSDGPVFVRRVGLAAGPPDSAPADFVLQRGLGSVVAALARAGDSSVENVTYDGRPAWLLRTATGNRGEERLVTVDRATGVPVRNRLLRNGHFAFEWRIEGLRVSRSEARIRPLRPAHGQNVRTYDGGFHRVSVAQARRTAGYAPLVPAHLPKGFALAGITVAKTSRTTGEEGGGGNPASRDVVSVSFRRGFDEIVVTTRRTGPRPSAWRDPLQVSRAVTAAPRRVVFRGGALAGTHGYLVLEPDALPHVWAAGRNVVVTIAGTVSPGELLRIANSLRAR